MGVHDLTKTISSSKHFGQVGLYGYRFIFTLCVIHIIIKVAYWWVLSSVTESSENIKKHTIYFYKFRISYFLKFIYKSNNIHITIPKQVIFSLQWEFIYLFLTLLLNLWRYFVKYKVDEMPSVYNCQTLNNERLYCNAKRDSKPAKCV